METKTINAIIKTIVILIIIISVKDNICIKILAFCIYVLSIVNTKKINNGTTATTNNNITNKKMPTSESTIQISPLLQDYLNNRCPNPLKKNEKENAKK